jgi:putative hydrolase of the HAD superfamily
LIYYPCGIRFRTPIEELELPFWDACAQMRPMPGALDALMEFQRLGVALGLVSNSSFGATVLRHELAKHGLADPLSVIVTSAEFAVRKPNPLIFGAAASLLGVGANDIWVIGDRLDTDIAGANAAGMHGVQYAPSRTATTAADLQPVTWPEIVTLVRRALDSGRALV